MATRTAAQVLDGLAGGQLVEGAVGECRCPGQLTRGSPGRRSCRARRPWCRAAPSRRGRGRGPAARADLAVLVAEQVTQPLLHRAAGAPAGMDAAGLPAVRAAAPEAGVGAGAGRAQRLGGGAAADRPGLAAARAPGPALLAGPAPWLAGGLGDHAGGVAPADRAGQDLPWHAVRAQRPAGSADADRPAAAAAGADLLVGRVGDQAVGAQRLAVLVTGGDLPDRSAPCARLGAGPGHAVAARPLPVDPPVRWMTRPQRGAWRRGRYRWRRRRRACRSAAAPTGRVPGLRRRSAARAGLPGPRPAGGAARTGRPLRAPRLTTAPAGSAGSIAATIPAMTAAGSGPSPGGHWRHRGCPSRSRKVTCRVLPQAAQGSRRRPQARQYQSWPRRCRAAQVLAAPGAGRRRDHGGALPCAARSAGPRRPGAPGNGRRPGPPAARRAPGRACAAWPGRPRR